MKTMLRTINDQGKRYSALAFICPGCALQDGTGLHMLPVNTDITKPAWAWDGNLEAPTISPSIKTESGNPNKKFICHSFLQQGIFDFLGDSTHALAGQKIPIPDLPDWFTHEEENTMPPEDGQQTEAVPAPDQQSEQPVQEPSAQPEQTEPLAKVPDQVPDQSEPLPAQPAPDEPDKSAQPDQSAPDEAVQQEHQTDTGGPF